MSSRLPTRRLSRSASSSIVSSRSLRRGRVERHVLREEARGRGLDRRQRSAEVVTHRREQRGPQLVGLGERGRAGGLRLETPTLERRRRAVSRTRRTPAGPRRAASNRAARASPRPASGIVTVPSTGDTGGCEPAGSLDPPSFLRRVQHRAAVEPGRCVTRSATSSGRGSLALEHDRGHPRQRTGFRARAVRIVAPSGREVDEHADHTRDDEERDEREQVAAVRDREGVEGRCEEPVEQHECREPMRLRRAARRRWSRPRRRAGGSTRSAFCKPMSSRAGDSTNVSIGKADRA